MRFGPKKLQVLAIAHADFVCATSPASKMGVDKNGNQNLKKKPIQPKFGIKVSFIISFWCQTVKHSASQKAFNQLFRANISQGPALYDKLA